MESKGPRVFFSWLTLVGWGKSFFFAEENSWGGAIELSILAEHFECEIAAYDSWSCNMSDMNDWVVVSKLFYFHPYLGKMSNLANIFQMGWNHQLEDGWWF